MASTTPASRCHCTGRAAEDCQHPVTPEGRPLDLRFDCGCECHERRPVAWPDTSRVGLAEACNRGRA